MAGNTPFSPSTPPPKNPANPSALVAALAAAACRVDCTRMQMMGEPGNSYRVIDIVVPAHNEGASIGATLREFHRTVAVESKIPICFVVCEDGSSDDTVPVLRALAAELPLRLISSPMRKGYSRAVIDGLLATQSDWVACIDSDGQCDPGDFAKFLTWRDGADLVVGWRSRRADPWRRKAMSGAFGWLYRLFFDVRLRDPSCPYILIRRASLESILAGNVGILRQGFWWEFSARATALGLAIRETPVHHRIRTSGTTQIYRPARVPRIAFEHLLGLRKLRKELNVPPRQVNALLFCPREPP
jgi:dolichol-phosphate mannosyltransferase